MTHTIKSVRLDQIEASPARDLDRFPLQDDKLALLRASIEQSGLWPFALHTREASPGRFQLVTGGHHRHAAALDVLGPDHEVEIVVYPPTMTDDEVLLRLIDENGVMPFSNATDHVVMAVEKISDLFERMFDRYPTYADALTSGEFSESFLARMFGPETSAPGKYAHIRKEGVGRKLILNFSGTLKDAEVRPVIAVMKGGGAASMEAARRLPKPSHVAAFQKAVTSTRAADAGLTGNEGAQLRLVDDILSTYKLSRNSADPVRSGGVSHPTAAESLTAKNITAFVEAEAENRISPSPKTSVKPSEVAQLRTSLGNLTQRVKAATKQMADAKSRVGSADSDIDVAPQLIELNTALEAFDATKNGLIRDCAEKFVKSSGAATPEDQSKLVNGG